MYIYIKKRFNMKTRLDETNHMRKLMGLTLITEDKDHKVVQGDTGYAIAKKYGITLDELKELNPDIDIEKIQVGQELVVSDEGGILDSITGGITDYVDEKIRWFKDFIPNIEELYKMWDNELKPKHNNPYGAGWSPEHDAWNHMVMSALATDLFGTNFAYILTQMQEHYGTIRKWYKISIGEREFDGMISSNWLGDTMNNDIGIKIGAQGGGLDTYKQKAKESIDSGNWYDQKGNYMSKKS
jgi:LysM repeat protein